MAISFTCPSCDSELKLKDELAGRKVKCPRCGDVVVVPAEEEEESRAEESRKKKKKKRKKKGSTALIAGIAIGVLLLVGGGIAIVFAVTRGKEPERQAKAPAPPPKQEQPQPQFEPKPRKGKDLISAIARRMESSEVNNWFHQLGLAYQTVATANTSGRGPANFNELGREFANTPLKEWFDKGWITVVWGVRASNQPAGASNTALAWETDADGQGQRIVLMCSGSIQTIDEPTFANTARAK